METILSYIGIIILVIFVVILLIIRQKERKEILNRLSELAKSEFELEKLYKLRSEVLDFNLSYALGFSDGIQCVSLIAFINGKISILENQKV